jgi:O-6-methylguanine DNA methyltransferase
MDAVRQKRLKSLSLKFKFQLPKLHRKDFYPACWVYLQKRNNAGFKIRLARKLCFRKNWLLRFCGFALQNRVIMAAYMKTCSYYEADFCGLKTGLVLCVQDEKLVELSFGSPPAGFNTPGLLFAADSWRQNCLHLDSGGAVHTDIITAAWRQIAEYAAGRRRDFDLPVEISGTEFQMKVWNALTQIPYGETVSYQDIAQAAGNRAACRAAGGAIHRNPVAIIIPCHRVIGANGSLTGFGGGLAVKEKLLYLERQTLTGTAMSRGLPIGVNP